MFRPRRVLLRYLGLILRSMTSLSFWMFLLSRILTLVLQPLLCFLVSVPWALRLFCGFPWFFRRSLGLVTVLRLVGVWLLIFGGLLNFTDLLSILLFGAFVIFSGPFAVPLGAVVLMSWTPFPVSLVLTVFGSSIRLLI